MEQIVKLDTVGQYNEYMGVETFHPLVNVVDLSKVKPMAFHRHLFGFYTIFLKDVKCGNLIYGCHTYDYQEGTLVFIAPGQVSGVETKGEKIQPKGYALVFHPDLLYGTSLGKTIRSYNFFSYEVSEALHMSEQERKVIIECLNNISYELQHAVDKHSKTLIVRYIELFIDYCTRFYDRQFITREHVNQDILVRFEKLVEDYFNSDKPQSIGFPTVSYCADQFNLSPNYFGDMIKKEIGKTAQEYIQNKMMDVAREKLTGTDKPINEIAYELGFKYPQHFSRMFSKQEGISPNVYRSMN